MKTRILIVEDDADSAWVCQTCLEDAGYHAVIATSGPTAAAEALALQPAVILLDLLMPGVDGWEVARQLQAEPRTATIPIVIMSAMSHVSEQTAELHVASVLAKPYELDHLLRAVHHVVRPAS